MKKKNYDFSTFVSPPSSLRLMASGGDHPHSFHPTDRPGAVLDVEEGDTVKASARLKGENIIGVLATHLRYHNEETVDDWKRLEGSFDWTKAEYEVVARSDGVARLAITLYTPETEEVNRAWVDDVRMSVNDRPVYYNSMGPLSGILAGLSRRLREVKLPTLGLVR